jgi:FtsZ-binding cell division protein ZapB
LYHRDLVSPDCPRHIGAKKADTQAWEKICQAVDKPEYLLGQARNLVEELRSNSANLHEEQTRIQNELEALMTERQWVITQARKGAFTTADMEQQLDTLTIKR